MDIDDMIRSCAERYLTNTAQKPQSFKFEARFCLI